MPYFVEESLNHTVPSAAIAALLQNRIGDAVDRVGHAPRPRRCGCRRAARPRWASQTSSRPSRSISMPSGRPPVWAIRSTLRPVVADPEDAAVLGAGEDRALVGAGAADDDVLGAVGGDRDHRECAACAPSEQVSVVRGVEERRHDLSPQLVVWSRARAVSGSTKTIWRPSPEHDVGVGQARSRRPDLGGVEGAVGLVEDLELAPEPQRAGRESQPGLLLELAVGGRLVAPRPPRRGRRAVPTSRGRSPGARRAPAAAATRAGRRAGRRRSGACCHAIEEVVPAVDASLGNGRTERKWQGDIVNRSPRASPSPSASLSSLR